MWPAPNSAVAPSGTPLSVLTKSAARASRSAHALAWARISSASGPRPCSRALVASVCFLGRNGRYKSSSRLTLSARSISLPQLVGQFVLRFDRAQDRLLAFVELPQLRDARRGCAPICCSSRPPVCVAAIARDERHRVAVVQQRDRAGDRVVRDAKLTREAGEVDRSRRWHEKRSRGMPERWMPDRRRASWHRVFSSAGMAQSPSERQSSYFDILRVHRFATTTCRR